MIRQSFYLFSSLWEKMPLKPIELDNVQKKQTEDHALRGNGSIAGVGQPVQFFCVPRSNHLLSVTLPSPRGSFA